MGTNERPKLDTAEGILDWVDTLERDNGPNCAEYEIAAYVAEAVKFYKDYRAANVVTSRKSGKEAQKLRILENERLRQAFDGVAELYDAYNWHDDMPASGEAWVIRLRDAING